ncbi:ribosomal protection-like ABC-F family protein [Longirhabdus pacifica]|uniref:ribosomal protection-like ABC-F family protein n=1 Tax=Longirhabdus pacifica TaxID=2305227 RepID=UPI001F0C334D|nr:ABC-F type ribosomal protection protein [Longirhabdus pacifica]
MLCSVNEISKNYGGNPIFTALTLQINENERIGLVGHNGSGKTTLMKILAGQETADTGQVHWKKGTSIGYLAQIPSFPNTMTVHEVLRTAFQPLLKIQQEMKTLELKMATSLPSDEIEQVTEKYGVMQETFTIQGGYEIEENIERMVNGLQIHALIPQLFSQLSGGEKTKVSLALMLLQEPELLLLDEPTNHLDIIAMEWLGKFIQSYKGTVVIISHDRYFLDETVHKIIDLEQGELSTYFTNYSDYVKQKEERILKQFADYENQQKKIKKMKEAIKRLREWANRSNPPNEGLHKRAKNMERALQRMEKIERPPVHKKMKIDFDVNKRSGKEVIKLQQVSKSFANKEIFRAIQMNVQYKDKIAIVGGNGTGKSTLLKMILNQLSPDQGEVLVGSNVNIGYVSQDSIDKSIVNERVIDAFRREVMVSEAEARQILAAFMFYGHAVFRKVDQLSGGERVRLRLAQLLQQNTNCLILDEPTNHLDIASREVLEEALENYEGTVITVSHDRYFLNRLFHNVYWIEDHTMYYYLGNYDEAKKKHHEFKSNVHHHDDTAMTRNQSKKEVTWKEAKSLAQENVEQPKAIQQESDEQQWELLERNIEQIEKELQTIYEQIQKQIESVEDSEQLNQLYSECEDLEQRRNQLYEQLETFLS